MNKSKATPSQLWLEHVYDSDLSAPAKAVAAFLKSRMYGNKNHCWPSLPTIAEKTGFGLSTVRRGKNQLIGEKWLSESWPKSSLTPIFTTLTPVTLTPPVTVTPVRDTPLSEVHPLSERPDPPVTVTPEVVREVVKNIHRFKPPDVDEVKAYCDEKQFTIDPETFVDWNASKGWMIGKNKMKDWKAAVRTWNKRERKDGTSNGHINGTRKPVQPKRTVADRLRDQLAQNEAVIRTI